jgi:hypothetical protein
LFERIANQRVCCFLLLLLLLVAVVVIVVVSGAALLLLSLVVVHSVRTDFRTLKTKIGTYQSYLENVRAQVHFESLSFCASVRLSLSLCVSVFF